MSVAAVILLASVRDNNAGRAGAAAGGARAVSPAPLAPQPVLSMARAEFSSLQDWASSDPRAALSAFRRSCVAILNHAADVSLGGTGYAGMVSDWRDSCQAAFSGQPSNADESRKFFESSLSQSACLMAECRDFLRDIMSRSCGEVRTRHGSYQTPVYGLPSDLVKIEGAVYRDTAAGDPFFERMMMSMSMMRYVPYPARADIEREGIPAQVLFYVDDPIDAFFLQIQGSGRVALDDGTVVRAAYAGQNGQPYTAIGSVLLERGELTSEELSLQSIRAWLVSHPDQARDIMDADEVLYLLLRTAGGRTGGWRGWRRRGPANARRKSRGGFVLSSAGRSRLARWHGARS